MDTALTSIMAVEVHKDYPDVIKITTIDGRDWHYRQDSRGMMRLGYPYVIIHGKHYVHLFVPLAPGELPTILKVGES